jgi:hypothetical protein
MCGIRQLRLRIIITTGNRPVTSIFVTPLSPTNASQRLAK